MPLVSKAFGDIITFTRASGATWFNSAGNLIGVDFSTSSNTIGTGSKTFTLNATAGVDRSWATGDTVLIVDQANSANNMTGAVTSYTASTQALVVNVTSTAGSGTITSWRVGNLMQRLDYDPSTLAAQGLLIEEARANSIRNNTMQGASAGVAPTNWPGWNATINGVTIASSAAGTENGIAYIDVTVSGTCTLTGTAHTPAFETSTQVAATVGQTWTESVYWTLVSGSLGDSSFNVRLTEADSGGGSLTSGDSATVVPAVGNLRSARYTFTRTLTNASTAFLIPRLRFGFVNGSTYNFTIRIGLPQLELGAFATSVIPTTTTALTRNADQASVNTLSPWFNATEGTLFAEWASFIPNGTSPGSTYAAGFTDNIATSGAAQLTIQNRAVSNQIRVWQSTTGGGLDDFITPTNTTFQGKAAATYGGGSNVNASANGGAVVTMTNPIQTTAFNALLLGLFTTAATGSGSNYLNGYLRRVVYYPRRLSNAELQSITS